MPRSDLALRALTGLTILGLAGCVAPPPTVTVSSLSGLQKAIDRAVAGETIVIQPGVYAQTRPIVIRNKQQLTIAGATKHYQDVVLRGPGMDDDRLYTNIRLDNADNVTIENLTVRDSYYHGIQITHDSDGFIADHVRALDNGESGFKVTSPAHGHGPAAYSDHGTIENSVIGFTTAGRRDVVEGVDIVAGNGWHLLGNHFDHIRRTDGGPAYAAFAKGNAHATVFADNLVENSFIGLSFGGGGTDPVFFRNGQTRFETRGGIIRNNLIRDTDDAGIYLNKARDFLVQGNIVLRNGTGTGAIEARFPQSHGTIRHNRISSVVKERNAASVHVRGNIKIAPETMLPNWPFKAQP
ncbi:right-handed parallel beta-helix repeat-containing protein [Salinisphaera sp. SPP-AMP-43]|uniref:right-handed parallel beta-helix repeat-containing protein n=1 Tax=Salinisphaera sp. SPP-AMP-43 TaxID=3121288 RepID=UPI003C6DE72A